MDKISILKNEKKKKVKWLLCQVLPASILFSLRLPQRCEGLFATSRWFSKYCFCQIPRGSQMLDANKAHVIIRHVVYVGHCQPLAWCRTKKSKENELSPDRRYPDGEWQPLLQTGNMLEISLSSEGPSFFTCKMSVIWISPFASVSGVWTKNRPLR